MTTLPQTTGARFPRAGLRSPSIPSLAHANAASAPVTNALGISDVLRVLRANAWLIILCVLISLIAGYLINNYVFMRFWPTYTARAVLQIQTPQMFDLNQSVGNFALSRDGLDIKQKTIAQKIMSEDLWRPLLQNDRTELFKTDWMNKYKTANGVLDLPKATEAISKSLRANPNPQTEYIIVELSAPTANDAKVVLDAIVTRLLNTEQNDVKTSTSEERTTYQTLYTRTDSIITGLNQAISASLAALNASGGGDNGNGVAMTRQFELQQLIAERIRKESDFNEAAGMYQQFAQQFDQGLTPGIVEQQIEMNMAMQRLQADLDNVETSYEVARSQYGESHRVTTAQKSSLDVLTSKVEQKRAELRTSMGSQLRETLGRQAQAAKSELDAVVAQIAQLEKVIGEQNIEYAKLATNRETLRYAEAKKQKIEERLLVLDANANRVSDNRGAVKLTFPIEAPNKMSFPNLKMTLAAAGLLGLCMSLGIAFLREILDTSVRSPRDIQRVGQLNLLGMIPHTDDDPQAAAGELGLIISAEPHSIIAENFRQVRTRLHHTASLDTTRSLLITSPGPGDGKTIVATNIAAGLALNGRKILLVDANFRRPDLHRMFGLSNDVGFGSVLSQAVAAESAIKHTSVPNLDVLTTGPRPANTTELLESQLLTDFIDRQLEEYDHVIFDTGPILLVSETVALAPRVDGVISVVLARSNSRGLLTRMRDALRQLKAEHLGVVLNGVRQHSGGYYARNIKNYYAYQNGK
jgi:polysaccharide biosynthesis transport protein